MKPIHLGLLLALCAPFAWADDPAVPAAELDAARAEVERAHEALRAATRSLERLAGQGDLSSERHISITRQITTAPGRPVIGVVMDRSQSGEGVRLSAVTPGGPAAVAGVRSGDRLLAINGSRLDSSEPADQAMALLEDMKAGDEFELLLRRGDDTELSLGVIAEEHSPTMVFDFATELDPTMAGEWQVDFDVDELRTELERVGDDLHLRVPRMGGQRGSDINVWRFGFGWAGLELARLNPGLGRYFGVEEGALVIEAKDIEGELIAGDVILSVQGRPVREPGDVMRELRRYGPTEVVEVEVVRDGRTLEVTVTAPDRSPGNAFFFDLRDGGEPGQN